MARSWTAATLLAWVAMIGVDLLLHAGLLAPLYDWDSPFLLSPQEAFIQIPAAYLAFGVLAGGLRRGPAVDRLRAGADHRQQLMGRRSVL